MICLDCANEGVEAVAVALRQSCYAGVCAKHAVVTDRLVTRIVPITKVVALPKPARQITCRVCWDALNQLRAAS
ncbi:MAG: DUF2180 family protein [Bryobacteraceae bacterium]|nr:DUF2180 family protein [Bryobacteraceae bacterium]